MDKKTTSNFRENLRFGLRSEGDKRCLSCKWFRAIRAGLGACDLSNELMISYPNHSVCGAYETEVFETYV